MMFPKEIYKKEQPKKYIGSPISLTIQTLQELKKVPFEYVFFPKQVIFIEEKELKTEIEAEKPKKKVIRKTNAENS